ncbi:MAG: hypothetical protein EA426_06580 [Spirochaetaceae bacterium]|nr:MAG: hypothetical protein EA426_06580 [Spirochaetaceae bacterium]
MKTLQISLRILVVVGIVTGAAACRPFNELLDLSQLDLHPPRFLGISAVSPTDIILHFDEEATVLPETLTLAPAIAAVSAVSSADGSITIGLSVPMDPGAEYVVSATVVDRHGNSLGFAAPFFGFNPNVPELLITEFTCRGSATNPDKVELLALTGGNLAGVTLSNGSHLAWDTRMVFPALTIAEGEYVVVHFRPQGVTGEIDEIHTQTDATAAHAIDTAWDFWVPGGSGLPSNNGSLVLTDTPRGRIIDAVIWSNRTSASDEAHRGFGSRKMMERVDEIVGAGGWRSTGAVAAPEDAVNPDGSTATRSICRGSDPVDTDTRDDWHIVPTRGATFGLPNTDDRHEPAEN